VHRIARDLDIPFCVAGGIRSVRDAEDILNAGAEKISVNSPALANPSLIEALSRRFGSQCVVVGIDSQRQGDTWHAWQFTGETGRASDSGRRVSDWVGEVQDRGAGEIVLNCMGSDGVRNGFDLEQIATLRERVRVPLIASGGAGCAEHFRQAFECGADGALAASVFHSGSLRIGTLKQYLSARGVQVRP
jgi:cyclase